MQQKLPLWRLFAGLGVLGCILAAAGLISPVYVANYRFARFVKTFASTGEVAGLTDDVIRGRIVGQAQQFHLPVHAADIAVRREGPKVRIQVARYKAQVWHADLHFPAIETK